jgi:hypothetical protein
VWCLKRSVELTQKPREGLSGIHYLFDKLSDEYDEHPGILLSLVGYLSDLKRSPKPFPIKSEEKTLLFPEIAEITSIEILSLEQMIEKFTLESIFRKEITRTINTRDITNLLLSVFMGGIVAAHMSHQSPIKIFFRRNIDLLLKGLQ